MIFKPYECDFGFKYNGVDYEFDHVDSLVIEDPRYNRIVRGSNAQDKVGLAYQEGSKEPETWTVTIMNMPLDMKGVLDSIFGDAERADVYCIKRSDGSSKMGRNAILCQKPQQLTVDETAESMNVILTWQTFDGSETFKS